MRTALATISVGAMLATGHAAQAQGATVPGETPAVTAPQTGTTGETSPTTAPGATGDSEDKKGKKKPKRAGSGKKQQKGVGGSGGQEDSRPQKPQSTDPESGGSATKPGNPRAPKEIIPDKLPLHVNMDPGVALPGSPAPVAACDGTAGPPRNLIPIYTQAAKRYGLGDRGPQILAAINKVETDFGRLNRVTSYAGAVGWMQFMPATWDSYGIDGDGDGKDDPYNPRDAIHSAANYLSAAGAPGEWYDAIWAYNHADWYVRDVLDKAACYGALEDTTEVDDGLAIFVCKPALSRSREIPNYLMRAFEDSASRYELGRRGVWALAAVARLESDYGRGMTRAEQAESGVMGFSRDEWKRYGVDGDGDGLVKRNEAWDAIASFARLLWSSPTIEAGLFEHNHAAWYVDAAINDAKLIAGDCETSKATWNIAFPAPAAAVTEINLDNLQILNPAARKDIQNGLIDPRVLNLLAILTQNHSLTVSSLRSDHGMMTTSGNVSNHYYGRAMDIAAVDGVSCTDMSPEGPCATVGRLLTLLPDGAGPTELIYGFDLDGDGPAFAMADHRDHIHAGFGP